MQTSHKQNKHYLILQIELQWRLQCASSKDALYRPVYSSEAGHTQAPSVWITRRFSLLPAHLPDQECSCLFFFQPSGMNWSAVTWKWYITGVNAKTAFIWVANVSLSLSLSTKMCPRAPCTLVTLAFLFTKIFSSSVYSPFSSYINSSKPQLCFPSQ